jgi:23S rRNA pseudouridine1911/1915/1917 synthase
VPRDDDVARWIRRGSCTVGTGGAGVRLDAFLARTFPYRSRTSWAALIRRGRVRLNDAVARPARSLHLRDRIAYLPDPRPEPRVSCSFRVLYEDEEILAVRKPANLPVHPSGRYYRNTLLLLLLEKRGESLDKTDLRIVHRLDRETSGLILFGKSKEAAASLSMQFESREVRKKYLAIVHGRPQRERFLIDAPIGRSESSPIRKAMSVRGDGRPARTSVRVLRRGPEHALLAAQPHTGRLHQIRVHLNSIGHPIVGDKVYGLDPHLFLRFVGGKLSRGDRERLLWRRQALHAWKLSFRHPRDGRPMTIRASAGGGWRRLMQRVGLGER